MSDRECIDCGGYVEHGQKYCNDCIADNPSLEKTDACTCWLGICITHNKG